MGACGVRRGDGRPCLEASGDPCEPAASSEGRQDRMMSHWLTKHTKRETLTSYLTHVVVVVVWGWLCVMGGKHGTRRRARMRHHLRKKFPLQFRGELQGLPLGLPGLAQLKRLVTAKTTDT